jgi:hypothetical protein
MLTKDFILDFWISQHGELTDELKRRFLLRSELDFLVQCPERVVRRAIFISPKLSFAVKIAEDLLDPKSHFSHDGTWGSTSTREQMQIWQNNHPNAPH